MDENSIKNVVSGVLVIDKPIGLTSHDVVQIARRGTGIRSANCSDGRRGSVLSGAKPLMGTGHRLHRHSPARRLVAERRDSALDSRQAVAGYGRTPGSRLHRAGRLKREVYRSGSSVSGWPRTPYGSRAPTPSRRRT